MKKINYLMMLLYMATISSGFVSCGSDDDDDSPTTDSNGNPSVVGTWYWSSEDDEDWDEKYSMDVTLVFNANQTGKVQEVVKYKGTDPTTINGSFEYVISWKDGVGTLIVTNEKGTDLMEGNYTINSPGGRVILTSKSFKIGEMTFTRK